jgi:hypothetical protein
MKGRNHSDPSLCSEQALALLGHELDNVLNGLLGMLQLLRESGLSPEQDRWFRAIEQSGRQMRRLVSNFRPAADQANQRPRLCPTTLDGIDLLEQVVTSHAPSAAANSNRLLLTVEPDVPDLWHCDPCSLRQVIDNLLGNALKFTAGGEVRLYAARARQGLDWLRILVVDSGPGIDPGMGDRIFEAWEQGHESIRRTFGGSGLGLYICHSAVLAMGGTLRWSTPASGGACFEVRLPGVLREEKTAPPKTPSLLREVHCLLQLSEPLRGSVAGWLSRLGVRWQDAGAVPPAACPPRLLIGVSELAAGMGQPGPILLLKPLDRSAGLTGGSSVAAPILGCSLGPALLGMVLEWLWVRDERRDSVP